MAFANKIIFNFIKSGDQFVAKFELSILVIDDDDYQVSAETVRDSIVVETADETFFMDESRAKLYTTYLPPGKFRLEIKLYDLDSGNQKEMARSFEVPNYHKERLSLSCLLYTSPSPRDS